MVRDQSLFSSGGSSCDIYRYYMKYTLHCMPIYHTNPIAYAINKYNCATIQYK